MYQVLYRKWRPKVFSDVVGQPHITSTLKNEIEVGRHSHAYLFTGSRGTGKTTCAKILAKAVNCLSPVNGDPCNECEVCRGIDNGTIMDVIEIDAASNNGVDNIRDIRQESNFTPASCKYRVYIIDEVHMLSSGAFNALLKTLEEPPAHVKFILATTEAHKLPATILSRCQRFDFRRISGEDMLRRMNYIAQQEGFTLDREAGLLISRIADGGMRDALSLLDQCSSRSSDITAGLVSRVAGLTSRDYLFRLADAINDCDCTKALEILDELHNSSCDMERLCSEMINHYRSLMIVKTVRRAEEFIVCTKEEFEETKAQSEHYSLESILSCVEILQSAAGNMKKGINKRTEMEMAVIKLSNPNLLSDTSSLLSRIAALEKAIENGVPSGEAGAKEKNPSEGTRSANNDEGSTAKDTEAPSGTDGKATEKENLLPSGGSVLKDSVLQGEEVKPKQAVPNTPKQDGQTAAPDTDEPFVRWPEVIEEIRKVNMPLWGVLDNSQAYIHGEFILVDCQYPTFGSLIRQGSNAGDVKKAIATVTGKRYRLGIYKRADTQTEKEKGNEPLDNLLEKMRSNEIKVTETE